MYAGSNLDAELADGGDDRRGAANGAGGAVEGRDEAFTAVADLSAAKAHDLGAHDPVVPHDQLARGLVTGVGLGDVYEQQGGEDPVGLDVVAEAGEESFDLVEQRFAVALPRQVVAAWEFDHARARDALAHVSRPLTEVLVRTPEHEGRHADRRQ
jgi:hypothetical protein